MSFSSATIHTRNLNRYPGGYSSPKSISLDRCHQLRTNLRVCKTERVITLNSRAQHPIVLKGPELRFDPLQCRRTIGYANALGARCAVAETQTMSRKSSSAVVSPPGKETLPMLDDGGGSGFRGYGYTPYYRGDGNGGGGGGGGGLPTSGDFPWGDYLFYIFLLLLRFLMMNVIGEGTCVYKYEDGRNKPIRRYV